MPAATIDKTGSLSGGASPMFISGARQVCNTEELNKCYFFFQSSNNTLSFPGKSHKVIQWGFFVSHQVMRTLAPNWLRWKIPKVPSHSGFHVSGKDHVSLNCRLYSAVYSKYFPIANVTDLTVYFPRHISFKLLWFESLILRKLALWTVIPWDKQAALMTLLIWRRSCRYN